MNLSGNSGWLNDLEFVRKTFAYDLKTGLFTWKYRVANVLAGSVAGSKGANGYTYIRFRKLSVLAHRLAWFYVYGEWPKEQVDHVNGDRSDNSLENLRLASQSQNSCNGALRSTNTSGYRGVSWSKAKKKWVASVVKERKQYKLGYFDSKEDAYLAYLEAARRLHGDFARSD